METPAFVVANYKPWLGPFTNTRDDLVNKDGEPLHFGVLNYNNTSSSNFREHVKPRETRPPWRCSLICILSIIQLKNVILCYSIRRCFSSRHLPRVRVCITTPSENPITCLLGLLLISNSYDGRSYNLSTDIWIHINVWIYIMTVHTT